MKILHRSPIYAGIKCMNGSVTFNWGSDSKSYDAIHLIENTSGIIGVDGVQYVYAYQYSSNATKDDERLIRNWLKRDVYDASTPRYEGQYLDKFLDIGISRVENIISFRKLNGIISIGSDSNLLDALSIKFTHYTNGFSIDMSLVKSMYDEITFDEIAAEEAFKKSSRIFSDRQVNMFIKKTKTKFETNKSNYILYKSQDDLDRIIRDGLQEFHIKDYTPREVRFGFKDFLKFGSAQDKQLYEEMQSGTILLYDDFYTSGATTQEAFRYLKSINDKLDIIVFILIKQY